MAKFVPYNKPWLTDILLGPQLRSSVESFTAAAEAGAKASASRVMAAKASGGSGRPVVAPVGSLNGPKMRLADTVFGKVTIGVGYGFGPESITDRWIGLVGSNSVAAGPYEFGREALSGKRSDGRTWRLPQIPATHWLSLGTGVKG